MRYIYRLENLCCANCAAKIENAINKTDGVISAKITFMTQRLTVEADESGIGEIEQRAEKIIRRIEPGVRMRKV